MIFMSFVYKLLTFLKWALILNSFFARTVPPRFVILFWLHVRYLTPASHFELLFPTILEQAFGNSSVWRKVFY